MSKTRITASRAGRGTAPLAPAAGRDSGTPTGALTLPGKTTRDGQHGSSTNKTTARLSHLQAGQRVFPHPLTWWVWAAAITLALTRVSNPLVIGLTLAGVILTAFTCREPRAAGNLFSATLEAALLIGAVIIVVRTVFYIVLGLPDSSRVILDLPGLRLPWFTNVKILGPLHAQGLANAVFEGARLAGLVIAFGAASALSNPRRALRFLPSSLHHLGTAAVIGVSGAPQLVESVARVRRAQALRAPINPKPTAVRRFGTTLIPVLSGALDHALILAGSMDSRGYARARGSSRGVGAALVVALLAAAAGTYGLLDATTPPTVGAVFLLGGLAVAVIASIISGRAVVRTRYFSPSWSWRESTIIVGAVIIMTATIAGTWTPSGLGAWRVGSGWPPLPIAGAAIALGALLPAVTRRRS